VTGQYPRRRETDAQAERRVERLEIRRLERQRRAVGLTRAQALALRPRISASGRLVTGPR